VKLLMSIFPQWILFRIMRLPLLGLLSDLIDHFLVDWVIQL
jgi:hypothetical protein